MGTSPLLDLACMRFPTDVTATVKRMRVEALLVCSVCHSKLRPAEKHRRDHGDCRGCGRAYPRREGFYDMTPLPVPDIEVEEKWSLWEQLQDNGAIAYEAEPETNLSFGRRRDAELFADFSKIHGLTLDVGCGPQAAPSYGLNFDGQLVGIDPLIGIQPRMFDFVQGIGEYLPFADDTFDRVLFATSLDHMLAPGRVMREASRVVRPDGVVSIWFAEHQHALEDTQAWRRRFRTTMALLHARDFSGLVRRSGSALHVRKRQRARSYMASLTVPAGAEDHFHSFHLNRSMVDQWIVDAGLRTIASRLDDAAGCFVMAKPMM